MLFNLAAAIGLETEHTASQFREDSVSIRQEIVVNADRSVAREIRLQLALERLDTTKPAANDEALPQYHYKGENLSFWMMPTAAVDSLRLKHGDSAWIAAKLRRVPASQRQKIADEYSAQYKATYDAEPDDNKKANKAAFAANSWLLRATR
jgi:hypothetical protein